MAGQYGELFLRGADRMSATIENARRIFERKKNERELAEVQAQFAEMQQGGANAAGFREAWTRLQDTMMEDPNQEVNFEENMKDINTVNAHIGNLMMQQKDYLARLSADPSNPLVAEWANNMQREQERAIHQAVGGIQGGFASVDERLGEQFRQTGGADWADPNRQKLVAEAQAERLGEETRRSKVLTDAEKLVMVKKAGLMSAETERIVGLLPGEIKMQAVDTLYKAAQTNRMVLMTPVELDALEQEIVASKEQVKQNWTRIGQEQQRIGQEETRIEQDWKRIENDFVIAVQNVATARAAINQRAFEATQTHQRGWRSLNIDQQRADFQEKFGKWDRELAENEQRIRMFIHNDDKQYRDRALDAQISRWIEEGWQGRFDMRTRRLMADVAAGRLNLDEQSEEFQQLYQGAMLEMREKEIDLAAKRLDLEVADLTGRQQAMLFEMSLSQEKWLSDDAKDWARISVLMQDADTARMGMESLIGFRRAQTRQIAGQNELQALENISATMGFIGMMREAGHADEDIAAIMNISEKDIGMLSDGSLEENVAGPIVKRLKKRREAAVDAYGEDSPHVKKIDERIKSVQARMSEQARVLDALDEQSMPVRWLAHLYLKTKYGENDEKFKRWLTEGDWW